MCGRITATFEFSDIRVRWNLDGDLKLYAPRRNISVGVQKVSVFVRRKNRQRVTVDALGFDSDLGREPFDAGH
jgi:hypothetical protein